MARATIFERSISRILVNAINESDKGPLHRDYKAHFRQIKKEASDDQVSTECEYSAKSDSESSLPAVAMATTEQSTDQVTKLPPDTGKTNTRKKGHAKVVNRKKANGGKKKKKGGTKKSPPIATAKTPSPRGQKRAADSPPMKITRSKRQKLSSTSHSDDADENTCDVCHLWFESTSHFVAHRGDYVIREQMKHTCKPCKTQFKRKRQLEWHARSAKCGDGPSSNLLRYFCHMCNQGMRDKKSLQAHIYHFHALADIFPGVIPEKPARADAKSIRKRSARNEQSPKVKRKPVVKVKAEPEEEREEVYEGQVLEKVQVKLGSPEQMRQTSIGDSVPDPIEEDLPFVEDTQSPVTCNEEEEEDQPEREASATRDAKVVLRRIDASLHPCKFCKQIFANERQREAHVDLEHLIFASSICEGKFPTMQLLVRHFLDEHQTTKPEVCCVCQETFEEACDSHHLELHCLEAFVATRSEKTSRISELACSGCDKRFSFATCLQVHQIQCEPWQKYKPAVAMELDDSAPSGHEESKPGTEAWDGNQALYPCDICGTRYRDFRNLWQHKQTYAGEMREQCSTCGLRFPTKNRLHAHVRATHDPSFFGEYKYRCKICNQGFGRLENCRVHEKHLHTEHVVAQKTDDRDKNLVEPDRESDQEMEDFGLVFAGSLEKPIVEVSNSKAKPGSTRYNGGPQVCDTCGVGFASKDEFLQHLFYFDPKESVQCTKCSRTFNGMFNLDNHHKAEHDVDSRNFQLSCNRCDERFQNPVLLNSHEKHVHENKYVVSKQTAKQAPKSVVTCKTCGLNFLNSDFLTMHRAEYSNDGPHRCDRCDRRCQTQALLDKHREATHSDASTRPRCSCSLCGEVTRSEFALEIHERHFHALVQPPGKRKPAKWRSGTYKCPTCKAIFDRRQNLSAHLIDFANFGDFHCEVCDRQFTDAGRLKTHREKHANFNKSFYDFRCFLCTEGFFTEMALRTHQIHLHPTPPSNALTPPSPSSSPSDERNSCSEGFLSDAESSSPQPAPENGGERPKAIPCNVCGNSFRRIRDLRMHQYRYLNNGDFMCDFCGRRFPWPSLFYHHYEKHTNQKLRASLRLKCLACGERFGNLASSRAHFVHIHQDLSNQGNWRHMIEWTPEGDPKMVQSAEGQSERTNETVGFVVQNQGPGSLLEPPPLTVRNSNIVVPTTPPGVDPSSSSSPVAVLQAATLGPLRPQQVSKGVSLLKIPPDHGVVKSVSTVPRKTGFNSARRALIPELNGAQPGPKVPSDGNTTRYACVSCGNFYQTIRDLENHYQMVHWRATTTTTTTEDRGEDAIADHQYFIKPARNKPVQRNLMCMKCQKFFPNLDDLQKHDKLCKPLVAHKCEICNTYYFDPKAWKCHMEYAHGFVHTTEQQRGPRAIPADGKSGGSTGRNAQKEVRERRENNIHPRGAQAKARGLPSSEKANTVESREKTAASANEKKSVGGLRVRPFAKIIENLARESASQRERQNCALGEGPQDF